MKKNYLMRITMVAMLVVTLIATMLAFVGCGGGNAKKNLQKPADVFALAGVSTGAMLEGMNANAVAMADETQSSALEGVVAELDEYMALIDSLISCKPSDTCVKASDRADYEKMQVMNVPDMNGTWTTYTLYYREDKADATALADEDEEDEEDESEEEFESHITGIMVIGEDKTEFPIKGDITVEREEDEVEQSIEFTAYLSDADYIVMEQSTENETEDGAIENSTEYTYKVYKDNKLVKAFELEVETEGTETEYSIETKDASGAKVEFELEKETHGDKTDVKVTYKRNGTKDTFKVESTVDKDGNPVYKYTKGNEVIETERD